MNKYERVNIAAREERETREKAFKHRLHVSVLNRDPYFFLVHTNIQGMFKYLSQD